MYNEIYPPVIDKKKLEANKRSLFQLCELYSETSERTKIIKNNQKITSNVNTKKVYSALSRCVGGKLQNCTVILLLNSPYLNETLF